MGMVIFIHYRVHDTNGGICNYCHLQGSILHSNGIDSLDDVGDLI